MLKSRTGYDQSVQTVMWAICGNCDVLVRVNRVFTPVAFVTSTEKNGRSKVAAGALPTSHESSLFVVAGAPVGNVAFGWIKSRSGLAANALPAISVNAQARVKSFFMLFSPTLQ